MEHKSQFSYLLVGLGYEEMPMKPKTMALATALALTSSLAFAQPAPIGSDATFGNRGMINRGPVRTTGEDMDFLTDRRWAPRHYRFVRHRRVRYY
jgi:hypothetical protein